VAVAAQRGSRDQTRRGQRRRGAGGQESPPIQESGTASSQIAFGPHRVTPVQTKLPSAFRQRHVCYNIRQLRRAQRLPDTSEEDSHAPDPSLSERQTNQAGAAVRSANASAAGKELTNRMEFEARRYGQEHLSPRETPPERTSRLDGEKSDDKFRSHVQRCGGALLRIRQSPEMLAHNPLVSSRTNPPVQVTHGNGPYVNTRRALESVDLSPVRGKRVLLKPNVGRVATAGSGIVTHPEVVAAAIDAFREAGAEVAVGESPIAGVRVPEAFAASGMAAIAAPRNCPLIDMDRRRFVPVPVPDGLVIQALKVCPEVLEFDFLVSVPVMKMHMHTGVSLSVKNMKGCLWRRSKVEFHMLPPAAGSRHKPIDLAIADMASVLRPHLAIVDGTVGMEGLGPSAGQPKPLDAVVVSADAFAADAVACALMGTAAEQIPHLSLGAERGHGVVDLQRLCVTSEHWRDWISPFAQPPENLTIEFPNITVHDQQSCSACQSTLLLFLTRYKDRLFDYFPAETTVQIAIGKGCGEMPQGSLLIGNCTAHQRDKGIFVPGCPPVGSQILAALAGQRSATSPRCSSTQDDVPDQP